MSIIKFRQKTTQAYENLPAKDASTMYIVTDTGVSEGKLYLGDISLGGGGGASSTETVQILFTSSDDNIDFTQYTVGVQEQGLARLEKAIDATGNCQFTVSLGNLFTIYFPHILNYAYIPEVTYRATLSIRLMNIQYHSLTNEIRNVVLERSNPSQWATSGEESVVDSLVGYGTYVIDGVHKKYAKLSSLDHSQFEDGTAWNGTYGDAFKHIPEVFYKMTTNEDTEPVLQISGYNLGEGSHSWADSWIGIYKGHIDSNNILRSIPNVSTTQNKNMTQFWEAAQRHTVGTDYGLVNYFDHCKLLALLYAKYGTGNSEEVYGAGLQNAGQSYYIHTTGTTAALGDATGSMQYLNTAYFMCKLFGIEDLAGSTWEFRPNIRFTSSQCIVYEGNVVSNDAQGRTFTRTLTSANSAYITKMELGEYCDFVPKAVGGSSGNYYCDGTWASSSGLVLVVGGSAGRGSLCGCSASSSIGAFGDSDAFFGARLAFKGDIADYELVTGADLAFINSSN